MHIILPLLAVGIGFLIAYFIKSNAIAIKLLLSFSGAFLLSITVFEFLPHLYQQHLLYTGPMIMLGIVIQLLLEYLSKGAEHGHLHLPENQYQFPYLLFISLCLHSLLEGYPIHHHDHMLYGVVIHKVPVAVIISSFLLNSNLSKIKIALFIILFGIMTPLGAFINEHVTSLKTYEPYINAMVVGVLLHVSTTILFESSKNHQFNTKRFLAIILGIVIAFFI